MKTVNLWSSTLLRLHKSINLSVLNSKKEAFVMHESQKVASNLFMIRTCFKLYSSLLKFIFLLLSGWDKFTVFECHCMY